MGLSQVGSQGEHIDVEVGLQDSFDCFAQAFACCFAQPAVKEDGEARPPSGSHVPKPQKGEDRISPLGLFRHDTPSSLMNPKFGKDSTPKSGKPSLGWPSSNFSTSTAPTSQALSPQVSGPSALMMLEEVNDRVPSISVTTPGHMRPVTYGFNKESLRTVFKKDSSMEPDLDCKAGEPSSSSSALPAVSTSNVLIVSGSHVGIVQQETPLATIAGLTAMPIPIPIPTTPRDISSNKLAAPTTSVAAAGGPPVSSGGLVMGCSPILESSEPAGSSVGTPPSSLPMDHFKKMATSILDERGSGGRKGSSKKLPGLLSVQLSANSNVKYWPLNLDLSRIDWCIS